MKKVLLSIFALLAVLPLSAQDVVLLSEDFSKFTAGSEMYPDRTDLCLKELDYCISPSLLHTPGWNGGGIYQAGGCAFIYGFSNEYTGTYDLGYLESPRFDGSGNWGSFVVRFRARTVLQQDWLGVCGVPAKGKAQQKFAVIGPNWGWYEVELDCGDDSTRVQFEPLEDGCYIDDITIVRLGGGGQGPEPQYGLDTPVVLPVEDYTSEGYTARWKSVAGADDYAIYDYLYHTARTDGEAFYYIDTDFSRITEGSEARPVSPGQNSDFGLFLDDYVGRADWLAHMPMLAGGCLGVDNSYAAVLTCGLESPALHLAAPGEPLYFSVDMRSEDLENMTLYAYGRTGLLAEEPLTLTENWQTYSLTIPKCEDGVVLELVVEDGGPGYAFIDNLRVWQTLKAGTQARVASAYYETEALRLRIETPDTPEDYRHAFSVSAYQYTYDNEGDVIDYIMSAWSAPTFVDGQAPEGLNTVLRAARSQGSVYDLAGRPVSSSRGIRIAEGRKYLR